MQELTASKCHRLLLPISLLQVWTDWGAALLEQRNGAETSARCDVSPQPRIEGCGAFGLTCHLTLLATADEVIEYVDCALGRRPCCTCSRPVIALNVSAGMSAITESSWRVSGLSADAFRTAARDPNPT